MDWINIPRKIRSKELILLNENFDFIETPAEFKLPLLEHQKRTVKAMIDLENKRKITLNSITTKVFHPGTCNENIIIETSAAFLTEKLGAGKTVEILAMISVNKKGVMRRVSEIATLPISKITKNSSYLENIGFSCEMRKTYNKTFPFTLIFVGKSVLYQWVQCIEKFTNLKVYVVEHIFHLREFYRLALHPKPNEKNYLKQFDIVLVKNGIISGKFDIPELVGTSLENVKSKSLLCIFAKLFQEHCFMRVVLDDFDTLNIPADAAVIPAIFTWFVSATLKYIPPKKNISEFYTLEDILLKQRATYVSVWHNYELLNFFNIRCEENYVTKSIGPSQILYYQYTLRNEHDLLIDTINKFGDIGRDVAEMLNGDAIKAASAVAGTPVTGAANIGNIFAAILDKEWYIYKKCLSTEVYINHIEELLNKMPLPITSDRIKNLSDTELTLIENNLRRPGPKEGFVKLIKYNYEEIQDLIVIIRSETEKIKLEKNKILERVKENLKDGECPILFISLKTAVGVIIMTCCGLVISVEAMIGMFKKDGVITPTRCPKCRGNITSSNMISVDKNIDIEDIITTTEEFTHIEIKPLETAKFINKYQMVSYLIKGDVKLSSLQATSVYPKFNYVMQGTLDKGLAEYKKVIIFANFTETLDNLEETMLRENISCCRLNGTASQIENIVNKYYLPNEDEEAINVLIINGARYCAGLNLQNTTTLIFMHKVVDNNVEEQIIARAARFGRQKNLEVFWVVYANESVK